MYYLATKSELTSIADGIRKVTGESSKISYPFIEAINNIQTLNLNSYDTLIGFTYNSSVPTAGNGMENLPESTYITFISDPYTSIAKIDVFPFSNSEIYSTIESTIAGFAFPRAKTITTYSEQPTYYNLKEVQLPKCETIEGSAFREASFSYLYLPNAVEIKQQGMVLCEDLISIDLPECKTIGLLGFHLCTKLESISLPKCETILAQAFQRCSNLSKLDLPALKIAQSFAFFNPYIQTIVLKECQTIEDYAFAPVDVRGEPEPERTEWEKPFSLYLNVSNSIPIKLSNTNAFRENTTIYVPESLYSTYIAATNWCDISSQIISTKNF